MKQPIRVERRGRKRKAGERHPCGKLKAEKIDVRLVALRMPHRASVPAELAHDPLAECEFGRMVLNGKVTRAEYNAGVWWRGTVNRMRVAIGAPNPNPASLGAEMQSRGLPGEIDAEESERRRSQYNSAFVAMMGEGGVKGTKAVSRTVVYDEPCPRNAYTFFRYSLLALAVHRAFLKPQEALDIREQIRYNSSIIDNRRILLRG